MAVTSVNGEKAKELLKMKDGKLRVFSFGATWCGHCQDLGIQLGIVAQEFGHKLPIYKINFDKNEALAMKYIGDGVPYTMALKNGKKVLVIEGYEDADVIIEKLEEIL